MAAKPVPPGVHDGSRIIDSGETPKSKSYLLTIRLPLDATDDPDARTKTSLLLEVVKPLLSELTVGAKLQEVFPDKPPRKVKL